MVQGKPIKGKFIWRTGPDRAKVVEDIKKRIESGYFYSRSITDEIVDKISSNFDSLVDG